MMITGQLRERHHRGDFPSGSRCMDCGDAWPCAVIRFINAYDQLAYDGTRAVPEHVMLAARHLDPEENPRLSARDGTGTPAHTLTGSDLSAIQTVIRWVAEVNRGRVDRLPRAEDRASASRAEPASEIRGLVGEWETDRAARERRLRIFHTRGEVDAYMLEYARIEILAEHIGALRDLLGDPPGAGHGG